MAWKKLLRQLRKKWALKKLPSQRRLVKGQWIRKQQIISSGTQVWTEPISGKEKGTEIYSAPALEVLFISIVKLMPL